MAASAKAFRLNRHSNSCLHHELRSDWSCCCADSPCLTTDTSGFDAGRDQATCVLCYDVSANTAYKVVTNAGRECTVDEDRFEIDD